jgi:hypothetical protein
VLYSHTIHQSFVFFGTHYSTWRGQHDVIALHRMKPDQKRKEEEKKNTQD